jgi:tetratricopeptide (TPR) repeat protein
MEIRLVHDSLRESRYAGLADDQKVAYHGRIAAGIERLFAGRIEEHYYDLSLHYARAGENAQALRYSLLGAQRATAGLAHGAAIEMLERALTVSPNAEQKRRIETQLADTYAWVGGYERARTLYDELIRGTDDEREQARLWRGIASVAANRGDMQPALDAIWKSVELLGGSVPPRGKAGVIVAMLGTLIAIGAGKLRGFGGSLDENARAKRLELASTYLHMATIYFFVFPPGMMLANLRAWLAARPCGASEQLARAEGELALIFAGVLGLQDLGAKLIAAARQTVQQARSPWREAFVESRAGALAIFRGDYTAAIAHLGLARRGLQQYGDYHELGFAWVNLTQAYYFSGRFREGYALALEGYEVFERIGSDLAARQFLSMMTTLGARIGISSEVKKARDGIMRSEMCTDYSCQCIGLVYLGAIHASIGELENALSALREARQVRTKHGVKFHYAEMLDVLELDILLRIPGANPRALSAALRDNRRIARARPGYAAWVALNEANFEWLRGRPQQAMPHYSRARALAEEQGAKHLLATIHADLSRADPADARSHLKRALVLHRECGAVHDERVVEEALRRLPG